MHYYQHHLGDYSKDTGHLSLAQHGAYRRLMDHYYATEAALTGDLKSLYRICGAVNREEKKAVEICVREFFHEENGKLSHARIEKEIATFRKNSSNNAEAGKASGEARRAKREALDAAKLAQITTNERSTNVERSLNKRSISVAPFVERTMNHEPLTNVLLEKEPKEISQNSQKQVSEKLRTRGTLEELRAYAVSLDLPASDGESMFDHWQANGWKNGSNTVKDWRAGIRKWKSQGWLPSQKPNVGNQRQKPKPLPWEIAASERGAE